MEREMSAAKRKSFSLSATVRGGMVVLALWMPFTTFHIEWTKQPRIWGVEPCRAGFGFCEDVAESDSTCRN